MPPQSPAEASHPGRLRATIVGAGQRLGTRGLISAGEGNLSVRLGDGNLLVTPSGRRKDELEPADLVVVPIRPGPGAAGMDAGGQASSDLAIHRAIYEARPDVNAVVHAHLPAAMALTLAGEVPDPTALPETALLLPRLPFIPFDTPGSDTLAAAVAQAFVDAETDGDARGALPGAVLLERHGAVAVGGTVDEAVNRLELVEVLCRTWRDALLIRAAITGGDGRAILRPPSTLRRDR